MSGTEKTKKGNEEVIITEAAAVEAVTAEAQESAELVQLTPQALSHFKEEEQKEILELADQIDVSQFDRIMSYGNIPLIKAFEQAGSVLKDFEGTSADQEVIDLVIELAKKASDSQEDFNLAIKEPGILTKLLLKISASLKDKNDHDAKIKAITCYKLLEQLRDSSDAWLVSLRDTYAKIEQSAYSDRDCGYELEKYIVAGRIAEERIIPEVDALKKDWEQTGLIDTKMHYDKAKRGLENFQIRLLNLEKSRGAFGISIGQLILQARANENIQLAVISQKENSMAMASQQIRNALFDMKNREALEGQKAITKLNDELVQKVSIGAAVTAEESEQVLLHGVYTAEAAIAAAQAVIEGCNKIEKVRDEMLPKIKQEMEKVEALINELAPVVSDIKAGASITGDNTGNSTSAIPSSTGLKF